MIIKARIIAIFWILLALNLPSFTQAEVETTSGTVVGLSTADTISYLSIPYALPPVGDRRLRPPVPYGRWEGILRATEAKSVCLQPTLTGSRGSEDCLTLNIWVPKGAKGPLPVMVYVHGGGLIMGGSTDSDVEGSQLAARGQVIVASMNYRVGALGFLAHPALSQESGYQGSGNYGLMDQILAYRWILANAANFGGDPSRVTLFGQSSGATSVCGLLTSPLSRSLVQRAVLQSQWCQARSLSEAEALGVAAVRTMGCESRATMTCLRTLPAANFLTVPVTRMLDKNNFRFTTMSLNVDGYALTERPLSAMARGVAADVPLILGSTAQDGLGLAPAIIRAREVLGSLDLFGMAGALKILDLYRPADYLWNENLRASAVINDTIYQCPARALARLRSRVYHSPTQLYVFDYGLPLHGSELPFVFQKTTAPADAPVAALVLNLWTSFARGMPASASQNFSWPASTDEKDTWLRINENPSLTHDHRQEYCDLYDTVVGPTYRERAGR